MLEAPGRSWDTTPFVEVPQEPHIDIRGKPDPQPPRDLRTLKPRLVNSLRVCGRDMGGLDLDVLVTSDHNGTWNSVEADHLSYNLYRCVNPTLQGLRRRMKAQRFFADQTVTLRITFML